MTGVVIVCGCCYSIGFSTANNKKNTVVFLQTPVTMTKEIKLSVTMKITTVMTITMIMMAIRITRRTMTMMFTRMFGWLP